MNINNVLIKMQNVMELSGSKNNSICINYDRTPHCGSDGIYVHSVHINTELNAQNFCFELNVERYLFEIDDHEDIEDKLFNWWRGFAMDLFDTVICFE